MKKKKKKYSVAFVFCQYMQCESLSMVLDDRQHNIITIIDILLKREELTKTRENAEI
jgi:hypothetical protein